VSEYQYYEFLAIDRPLSDEQQAELRELSTRARITATSFTNEYQWGSFRGDPRRMMERYFDAFLYLTNWASRELMIRLPAKLLGLATAEQYCPGGSGAAAHAWAAGGNVIVSLYSGEEPPDDYWEDGPGSLASIANVRHEVASGDLRFLYLAWLLSVQSGDVKDDEIEPPVPPGMQDLSGPLQETADFLQLNEDLLAVASLDSPDIWEPLEPDGGLAAWIGQLPSAEKDGLLLSVAQGDAMGAQAVLLRRFRAENPATGDGAAPGRRSAGELRSSADAFRAQWQRALAEKRAQEEARKAQQAAAAYEKRLDHLAGREEAAWQQVSVLIETKKPAEYNKAVAVLADLRALSQRDGRAEAFAERFGALREQHLRKPSLLERFDRAGLAP
jgi:hypothetical protein